MRGNASTRWLKVSTSIKFCHVHLVPIETNVRRALLELYRLHQSESQYCIGKEVSRFEQGKDDFIENIDDACIHYDGGRVAANESLKAEIKKRGLRKATKETGLDRKTIRAILKGQRVRASTLAKVVNELQRSQD